jgi:hypothetical protein
LFVFLPFYFYFATYNNMKQEKCIKKSTSVRRSGEKVTHRFFFTPEGSRWVNACLADVGDFGVE